MAIGVAYLQALIYDALRYYKLQRNKGELLHLFSLGSLTLLNENEWIKKSTQAAKEIYSSVEYLRQRYYSAENGESL